MSRFARLVNAQPSKPKESSLPRADGPSTQPVPPPDDRLSILDRLSNMDSLSTKPPPPATGQPVHIGQAVR